MNKWQLDNSFDLSFKSSYQVNNLEHHFAFSRCGFQRNSISNKFSNKLTDYNWSAIIIMTKYSNPISNTEFEIVVNNQNKSPKHCRDELIFVSILRTKKKKTAIDRISPNKITIYRKHFDVYGIGTYILRLALRPWP